MFFYVYQIILWIILLLVVSSKIKRKTWRLIFSLIASFFSTLEISAVYLTEKFIDYRFYNHINMNSIEGHGFQFITQFIIFLLLFVFLSTLFYFVSTKMNRSIFRHNKFFLPMILVLFILLSLPNGIMHEGYKVYKILNAEDKGFTQALKDLNIPPEDYILPRQVTAIKGKNIIIISIESLEQGFLKSGFKKVTPNLSKMSKEWTFYNHMPVSPGADWTAGSLYSYQVGVPSFFKVQNWNQIFQDTRDVKLTGLGHVLNVAGYTSRYIVGDSKHAGTSDLLKAYGIPVISQNNSIGTYQKIHYGMNDLDLFKEAKLQVNELQKTNKPFALFLSTINTHFPDGIYDKKMEKYISKQKNNLEFSVASIDYLIKDFIDYLKVNNLFENSAIFIFPDHLLMGSDGPVHKKLRKDKRQLYLLTNIEENNLPKKTSETLYQIDLPKMIIDGAEIKTNAKFLVDFIKEKNIIKFIKDNRVQITSLNTASVRRKNFQESINLELKKNKLIVLSDNNISISLPYSSTEKVAYDIVFDGDMRYLSYMRTDLKQAFLPPVNKEAYKNIHLIINIENGKINTSYLGNLLTVGSYKKNIFNYSKQEIFSIIKSNNIYSSMKLSKNNNIKLSKSTVFVTSSSSISMRRMNSSVQAGNQSFDLDTGLNLVTVNINGNYTIDNFAYGIKSESERFLKKIEYLINNNKFWVLAVDNAIQTNYPGFKEKLEKLKFKKLPTLNGGIAYIAYRDINGSIYEYSSPTTLRYIISNRYTSIFNEDINKKSNIELNHYKKDRNRFIAHAGGKLIAIYIQTR